GRCAIPGAKSRPIAKTSGLLQPRPDHSIVPNATAARRVFRAGIRRVRIAEPAIAGNDGGITLLERAVLAVPVHVMAHVDDGTPRRLVGLGRRRRKGKNRSADGGGRYGTYHGRSFQLPAILTPPPAVMSH